jgi:hypothetical protein
MTWSVPRLLDCSTRQICVTTPRRSFAKRSLREKRCYATLSVGLGLEEVMASGTLPPRLPGLAVISDSVVAASSDDPYPGRQPHIRRIACLRSTAGRDVTSASRNVSEHGVPTVSNSGRSASVMNRVRGAYTCLFPPMV